MQAMAVIRPLTGNRTYVPMTRRPNYAPPLPVPSNQCRFANAWNYRFQDHGNYNFGYHITDGYGAKNGREEHGDGYGNKKGSYYLQDVDGRWRKVGGEIDVRQNGLAN